MSTATTKEGEESTNSAAMKTTEEIWISSAVTKTTRGNLTNSAVMKTTGEIWISSARMKTTEDFLNSNAVMKTETVNGVWLNEGGKSLVHGTQFRRAGWLLLTFFTLNKEEETSDRYCSNSSPDWNIHCLLFFD